MDERRPRKAQKYSAPPILDYGPFNPLPNPKYIIINIAMNAAHIVFNSVSRERILRWIAPNVYQYLAFRRQNIQKLNLETLSASASPSCTIKFRRLKMQSAPNGRIYACCVVSVDSKVHCILLTVDRVLARWRIEDLRVV